jgi:chaperonin GroES
MKSTKRSTAVSSKLCPSPGYVLVKRDEAESKSNGGILLPEASKGKSARGVVVSCGADRVTDSGATIPTPCFKDDRVFFGAYAGTEIEHEGVKLLVLHATDILLVIGGS